MNKRNFLKTLGAGILAVFTGSKIVKAVAEEPEFKLRKYSVPVPDDFYQEARPGILNPHDPEIAKRVLEKTITPVKFEHDEQAKKIMNEFGKSKKIMTDIKDYKFTCPKCDYEQFCYCESCIDHLPKGMKPWVHIGNDIVACGNCGYSMHCDGWLEQEYNCIERSA